MLAAVFYTILFALCKMDSEKFYKSIFVFYCSFCFTYFALCAKGLCQFVRFNFVEGFAVLSAGD